MVHPIYKFRFSVFESRPTQTSIGTPKKFIVIRNDDGVILGFTKFEVFAGAYSGRQRVIHEVKGQELYYIVQALNFIFVDNYFKYRILALKEVTMPMVVDFFDYYREKSLSSENHHPDNQSLQKCVSCVSAFFANYAIIMDGDCSIHPDDLFKSVKREKRGETYYTYEPIYQKTALPSIIQDRNSEINHTIYKLLVDFAVKYDPMIAFAIVAQATAGLRGGEPMHMRQENASPPGIYIHRKGSAVYKIEIDLSEVRQLRSDTMPSRGIKKKRTVEVYPKFIPEFMEYYKRHQALLDALPVYEGEYAPMFVDSRGRAMSYTTYYTRFRKLVKDHLLPYLLLSSDPELVAYAEALQNKMITPHVLRHLFTTEIVADGCNVAAVMKYRGDKSPVSALTYISKGEIKKDVEHTADAVIRSILKKS